MPTKTLTQKTVSSTKRGALLVYHEDVSDSIDSTGIVVDNANYDLGTFLDRDYDVRIYKEFVALLQNIGANSIDYKILGATKDFTILATDLVDADFTEELVAEAAIAAAVKANGTVTCAAAVAGDTVTINGRVYTGVAGVKSDNTEFSIDTGNNETATDLADSITQDTRAGLTASIDQDATSAAAVVTVSAKQTGPGGNVIDLASSTGVRLAVSGATLAGGVDGAGVPYELERKTPSITAVKIRAKETAGGSPGTVRADIKAR